MLDASPLSFFSRNLRPGNSSAMRFQTISAPLRPRWPSVNTEEGTGGNMVSVNFPPSPDLLLRCAYSASSPLNRLSTGSTPSFSRCLSPFSFSRSMEECSCRELMETALSVRRLVLAGPRCA